MAMVQQASNKLLKTRGFHVDYLAHAQLESDARDKSPLLLPAFLRVASKALPDTHARVDTQSVPNRRRYAALVRERL
jgi:hypothetical protein